MAIAMITPMHLRRGAAADSLHDQPARFCSHMAVPAWSFAEATRMIPCVYILPIFMLFSSVGILRAADPDAFRSPLTAPSRFEACRPVQAVICGPNALYMLLRAHGRPVLADGFFREIQPGVQGLSLAELRDASTRYGLPAEVRCCTYKELISGCTFPLVALLQPGQGMDHHSSGHYVLVLDADLEGVTLVDGTSGEQDYLPRAGFCRSWKGYIVVPAMVQSSWLLLLVSMVPGWLLVGWLVLRSTRPPTIRLAGLEDWIHAKAMRE